MNRDRAISHEQVKLDGGFWGARQRLNADVTLEAVRRQFEQTGRFDAFQFNWKDGMPNKPHIFYDSDVAKWMEAASYVMGQDPRPEIEAFCDGLVDLIERHQAADGYFNVWFTVIEPEKRFQRRTEHELYCAGHLFEAAVAYKRATGKAKFLNLMCKYADLIERVFKTEASAAFKTPGHEEIELALVKLAEEAAEPRYLELAKWFIDQRGQQPEPEYEFAKPNYAQDHLPVREQTTAEGHSVRALYLYAGMADIALRYHDEALLSACKTLFINVTERRMYITGGVGSSRYGEAFTVDYDLMNATAYTESCAAIALVMFARRMLLMDVDGVYADAAERAMYNGFLSSTSLDGKKFFYENPLEVDLARIGRDASVNNGEVLPIVERVEVFSCSCCPPNIARFVASIADCLYTANAAALYVHHYMASLAAFDVDGRSVRLTQRTNYPAEGRVEIRIDGAKGLMIGLRVPGWCAKYEANVSGPVEKGYLMVACDSDAFIITLNFDMPPTLYQADPRVHADVGRAALMRGPVVYCLENVDNQGEMGQLSVDPKLDWRLMDAPEYGMPVVMAAGYRRALQRALYMPLAEATVEAVPLTFIPYYAFANRGPSDMCVWVPVYPGQR